MFLVGLIHNHKSYIWSKVGGDLAYMTPLKHDIGLDLKHWEGWACHCSYLSLVPLLYANNVAKGKIKQKNKKLRRE